MQITFDPSNPEDCALVATIVEAVSGRGEVPAPKTSAPAKKAAAKPAPAPEPTEESEEDLLGGDEEVTMEDAVAAATKLVSDGKAAQVKAALAKVGAKRVSEVAEADLAKFVASLA